MLQLSSLHFLLLFPHWHAHCPWCPAQATSCHFSFCYLVLNTNCVCIVSISHTPFALQPTAVWFLPFQQSKIPLQSTNGQQMAVFNGLSKPTAYTITWQYWQCPLKTYGFPNFISSSPYPHCSGLNLDLVKYSTTEPYATLFHFCFPLSCLGWPSWHPSTQAPPVTELQIYSIRSGLPLPFCSLPH